MQVLSDKLTSRCVTSYLSALVASKKTLMQQVALLQAAGALSASQGRVVWPTKGWGTNRTVTVWQTMQVLSDKLSSRCMTSYLSALVTSKTDSYATNRSLSSCCCVVSKSRTRYVTNQRAEAQTEQSLCDKLCRYYLTNYLVAVWQAICPHWWQAKKTLMQQVPFLHASGALSASQGRVMWPTKVRLRDKRWDDWGTNRTVTVWQTMQPLSDKLTSRCVTSYPSAFARTKTVSCMTSDALTSCRSSIRSGL